MADLTGLSGVQSSSNSFPSLPSPSLPSSPPSLSLPSVLSQPAPGANFGKPFFNLDAPATPENIAVAAGFALLPFVVEAALPAIAITGFPLVAGGLVSVASFLLACAAGLLPQSICPRPDNPSPGGKNPNFSGGQCIGVSYAIRFRVKQVENYYGTIYTNEFENQIGGFYGINDIFVQKRGDRVSLFANCNGFNSPNANGGDIELYGQTANITLEILFARVIRIDGFADNCGNAPPRPQPQKMPDQITNISNTNNNISINLGVPNPLPPSPFPEKQPLILTPPSPLPRIIYTSGGNFGGGLGSGASNDFGGDFNYGDPEIYFNPGSGANYGDQNNYFNNFAPSPQPNLNLPGVGLILGNVPPPAPAPIVISIPEIPPPLPDKLPDDATDSDKYIFRQNKELLDKLYRANSEILDIQRILFKQGKVLENIQNLLDIEVQGSQIIKRCDDIEIVYSYKNKILPAINRQLNHVKNIEQTIIDEVCAIEKETVVASPDWWQVRLKGDTPQLALVFRVANSRTYHKLTIPHPLRTTELLSPPIETYNKGNWQGEIVCVDNSKFLCNCETKQEAERLITIAASLINPIYLGDPYRAYLAERKGVAVSIGLMKATSALYFPFGQQQTKPQWRVVFTEFGV